MGIVPRARDMPVRILPSFPGLPIRALPAPWLKTVEARKERVSLVCKQAADDRDAPRSIGHPMLQSTKSMSGHSLAKTSAAGTICAG